MVAARGGPTPELKIVQVAIDARLQPSDGPAAQAPVAAIGQGVGGGHDHRGNQAVEIDQLNHGR
eukprot:8039421-Alexandrium_andersonii.AAC.1